MNIETWTGKPRVVEMMLWDGTAETGDAIAEWVGFSTDGGRLWRVRHGKAPDVFAEIWNTQELCWVNCPVGHRVAKGRLGEFYPISPAALEAGYVLAVQEGAAAAGDA